MRTQLGRYKHKNERENARENEGVMAKGVPAGKAGSSSFLRNAITIISCSASRSFDYT